MRSLTGWACPAAPHCASVSGFEAKPGRAPQPGWAGGLASAIATVPAFFIFWYFIFIELLFTNIVRDLFIPLAGRVFSFSNRFWDMLFFLLPFHGQVGLEITGFGTGCNFFCLSIQGFWMWTGKNFVKNQPWLTL
jgi:hypothetical protein